MVLTAGTKESYIGVFLENILYGAYISVFLESCSILWARRKNANARQIYLMVTAVLMVIFITTCCVIDTVRCVVALDSNGLNFGPPNTNIDIATNTSWFLVTAVADAFIIFRTFIVWNRNWFAIIIPSLLYVANFGSSIWLIISLKDFDPAGESVFQHMLIKSTNVFISLSLATNLLCTGLISFRIFYTYRQISSLLSSSGSPSNSIRIISILVESATMYTLLLTGTLISEGLNSYVNYILFDCTPPTIHLLGTTALKHRLPPPTPMRRIRDGSIGELLASTISYQIVETETAPEIAEISSPQISHRENENRTESFRLVQMIYPRMPPGTRVFYWNGAGQTVYGTVRAAFPDGNRKVILDIHRDIEKDYIVMPAESVSAV